MSAREARAGPDNAQRAARLFGAAAALRERAGAAAAARDRAKFERDVAAVRATLGPPAFDAAWAEGRAMPLDQAIAYALRGAGDRLQR